MIRILLCLFFITSITQGEQITSPALGGIFTTEDSVILNIKSADNPEKLEITDYNNHVVWSCKGNSLNKKDSNTFEIVFKPGELDPGFYIAHVIGDSSFYYRFGIVPVPQQPDPESYYGIDGAMSWFGRDFEDVSESARLIRLAGVSCVRDRISWNHVEPEKGKFNWKKYDPPTDAQSDNDLRILQVFHDSAKWASSAEPAIKHPERYAPGDLRDLYNFLYTSASHFKGRVHDWEVWNEFDASPFFAGTAEEYGSILKSGYLAIKSADPHMNVLFGSVTLARGPLSWGDEILEDTEGETYVNRVLENDVGDYFDVFNIHHYGSVEGIIDKLNWAKDTLAKYKLSHKPIWITEMGLTADSELPDYVTSLERDQANYLVKAYVLGKVHGAEKFYFFIFPTFLEHGVSNWGIFENGNDGWQPKPAYIALANLTSTLGDIECVDSYCSNEVACYYFEGNGKRVVILWGRENPARFSLKVDSKEIIHKTIFGKSQFIKNKESVDLILDGTPQYIMWNIPDKKETKSEFRAKSKTQSPLIPLFQATPNKVVVVDGESVTLSLDLYNFGSSTEHFQGDIICPEGISFTDNSKSKTSFAVDINKGDRVIKNWEVVLSPISSMQTLPIILKVTEGSLNGKTFKTEIFHQPAIEAKKLNLLNGNPELIFNIVNHSKKEIEISVYCKAGKDKTKNVNALLKPESECEIPVPSVFNDFANPVYLNINPGKLEKKYWIESGLISKFEEPPMIDGILNEWNSIIPFHLDSFEQVIHSQEKWKGEDDLSGIIRMGWDENSLYFSADVKDEALLNPHKKQQPWTGDAWEIFLDIRQDNSFGNENYSENVFQIFVIPPIDGEAEIIIWQPEKTELEGVKIGSVKDSAGYKIELSIPWKNFPRLNPGLGMKLSAEFTLDDIDPGDYSHRQMVWRGGTHNFRDASLFTEVILADEQFQ